MVVSGTTGDSMCPVTGAQRRRESSGSREVSGKRRPIWRRATGVRDDASCSPTVALDNNDRQQNKGTIVHVTPCECESPGWCERHQCEKSCYWFRMCQRVPVLFAAWEQGHGPGQRPEESRRRPIEQPCNHVGSELRTQKCLTCKGEVLLKVFGCALHNQCTLLRAVPPVACCRTCHDYVYATDHVHQASNADAD